MSSLFLFLTSNIVADLVKDQAETDILSSLHLRQGGMADCGRGGTITGRLGERGIQLVNLCMGTHFISES